MEAVLSVVLGDAMPGTFIPPPLLLLLVVVPPPESIAAAAAAAVAVACVSMYTIWVGCCCCGCGCPGAASRVVPLETMGVDVVVGGAEALPTGRACVDVLTGFAYCGGGGAAVAW